MRKMGYLMLLALTFGQLAFAYNFSEADKLFARRGEDRLDVIAQARAAYEDALARTTGDEAIYAVGQLGKLAYYEGVLLTPMSESAKREAIFKRCWENYVPRIDPGTVGQNGAYYYWKSACLALWGQAAGKAKAAGKIGQLKQALTDGLALNSSYEGGGIHRVAAAIYIRSKFLALFGLYSPAMALTQINKAIQKGPDQYNAYVIKAEVLVELGRKQEAASLLEETKMDLEDRVRNRNLPRGYEPESVKALAEITNMLAGLQ